MRNYRFSILVEAGDQIERGIVTVRNPELVHQIRNVLKLKPESPEEITLIDGSSPIVTAVKMLSLDAKQVVFKITDKFESARELAQNVRFFVPVIKAESFEIMLRKLTELGVQEFVPVVFERSQKNNVEKIKSPAFMERIDKIIREATEQCEGAVFSKIAKAIKVEDLEDCFDQDVNELKVYAYEGLSIAKGKRSSSMLVKRKFKKLSSNPEHPPRYNLLVGPEGGLSDKEVKVLKKLKFDSVSLGTRLLKAETAAIALFAIIVDFAQVLEDSAS